MFSLILTSSCVRFSHYFKKTHDKIMRMIQGTRLFSVYRQTKAPFGNKQKGESFLR